MVPIVRPVLFGPRLWVGRCNIVFAPKPNIYCCRFNQSTANTTIITQSPFKYEGSWFMKMRHKIGMGPANRFALARASIFHYEACTDKLDPIKYFELFQLPDTLYSFYLIVQLHVWMCQARSMREGSEGRRLRNEIVERMWQDFDTRLSKIEVYSAKKRKSILNDLLYHHQGAIFSYDEGLLADDKTLANALWRTLYSKDTIDPRLLELAVKYVRIQMNHVRSIDPREWCLNGKFDWAPFPLNNR